MKIYLYVLNTLADWEIGHLIAEFNSKRFFGPTVNAPKIIKLGNSLEPITTMGGIPITPDERVDDVTFAADDLLILPGADTWFEDVNEKVINIVAEVINNDITVAAICGATFALARKGILDTRKHTSNDKKFLKMMCPEYIGENLYLEQDVVVDKNLITASGLAVLDFSYEVFKQTNVMKNRTLEAWYQLYKTQNKKYFQALVESLKK